VSAAEALKAARDAGVELRLDGDGLVLEASAPPPANVLDLLSRHKAGVIALLQQDGDGWSAEKWLAFFDERAGIAEFDGGLPCIEAEACAFAACVTEWLNRNPERSAPGICPGCSGPEHAHDPLLSFRSETSDHAWLHHCCWSEWHAGREANAAGALVAMGIEERSIDP